MTVSSYLPITIVPTKTFQDNQNIIHLSKSLANLWGIHQQSPLLLGIGMKRVCATASVSNEIRKDEIRISEHIIAKLPLPIVRHRFLSQYDKKNMTLFLGPIIAAVTEINEEIDSPSFGSIHSFCEELHHISNTAGGFIYIFNIKNFSNEQIEGYYFHNGQWQKDFLVPPNVIYNRIHSRRIESSLTFKQMVAKINSHNIPFFNEQFLSKWDVFNILFHEDHLHPFLPETSLLSEQSLMSFLTKYPSIFIKPMNGSKGRNIIQLSKGDINLSAKFSTGIIQHEDLLFKEEKDFFQWFQKQGNTSAYIIQRTIPLITYKDRQLDFRVLCHKNHQDLWKITSTVARVSAENQFVSNLARGGEMLKPIDPLTKLFGRKLARRQAALMKELALETAKVISQSAAGLVGELGIDIGIDTNGELWIIEVNSKPSKDAEKQTSRIRPSAKAIFEYGTSLAFSHYRK